MYFSATGTTAKVIMHIAGMLSVQLAGQLHCHDFTLPAGRRETVVMSPDDIIVIGVPVYAGRVPNVLLHYLRSVVGNGARAIAVVVYGNRNYDDALIELTDILSQDGFRVIAGGAFIGEHSFSNILAQKRPDENDRRVMSAFVGQIAQKVIKQGEAGTVVVAGSRPYRQYYIPRDENGRNVDIRKVKPKISSACINCGLCAEICPMGSINKERVGEIEGICIKCCACIKKCPVQAKYFDDPGYINHKRELEIEFPERKEPTFFI